jgi:hypothetical protein
MSLPIGTQCTGMRKLWTLFTHLSSFSPSPPHKRAIFFCWIMGTMKQQSPPHGVGVGCSAETKPQTGRLCSRQRVSMVRSWNRPRQWLAGWPSVSHASGWFATGRWAWVIFRKQLVTSAPGPPAQYRVPWDSGYLLFICLDFAALQPTIDWRTQD